jgi:hypothetical protein
MQGSGFNLEIQPTPTMSVNFQRPTGQVLA